MSGRGYAALSIAPQFGQHRSGLSSAVFPMSTARAFAAVKRWIRSSMMKRGVGLRISCRLMADSILLAVVEPVEVDHLKIGTTGRGFTHVLLEVGTKQQQFRVSCSLAHGAARRFQATDMMHGERGGAVVV